MNIARYKISITGIVQGVGFRPFIYRTAIKHNITGFVKNTKEGVLIEAEGENVKSFIHHIISKPPSISEIIKYKTEKIQINNSKSFDILESENGDISDVLISPDITICNNCRAELIDPENRRYLYPFINCTDCGPRFTIIKSLPYDRPYTSMNVFEMCDTCKNEYTDPENRRYHSQPISCYNCGPELILYDSDMNKIEGDHIKNAADKIRDGSIISIKGIGGYHLACRADDDNIVKRLRDIKKRKNKPFALMAPLKLIEEHCQISQEEIKALKSAHSPIILLKIKEKTGLSEMVAPGMNYLGFMIPYTPVHVLLFRFINFPLIMTSANQSEEPIIFKDEFSKLSRLSDYILTNNRSILSFCDDSVGKIFNNNIYLFRRSRGYIPYPIKLNVKTEKNILGLGGMQKTTFSMLNRDRVFLSQYIGWTDNPATITREKEALSHYMNIFSIKPDIVVMDKHPNYPNRIIAEDFKNVEIFELQHHRAHIISLLAEKSETDTVIGVAMDGTGYGDDGQIWGGEFFTGDFKNLVRIAHLKYTFLPTGDRAIKEAWRYSISILHEIFGSSDKTRSFTEMFGKPGKIVSQIVNNKQNGVLTSSCGRLFDTVTSLLGISHVNTYTGELPSLLQSYAENFIWKNNIVKNTYNYKIFKEKEMYILDMLPAIADVIEDRSSLEKRAYVFHRTLSESITEMCCIIREESSINKIYLSGGVFQNTLLLYLVKELLEKENFEVYFHSLIPANDGGISLGQVYAIAGKFIK